MKNHSLESDYKKIDTGKTEETVYESRSDADFFSSDENLTYFNVDQNSNILKNYSLFRQDENQDIRKFTWKDKTAILPQSLDIQNFISASELCISTSDIKRLTTDSILNFIKLILQSTCCIIRLKFYKYSLDFAYEKIKNEPGSSKKVAKFWIDYNHYISQKNNLLKNISENWKKIDNERVKANRKKRIMELYKNRVKLSHLV